MVAQTAAVPLARTGLPPTLVVRLDLIDPSPYQPRTNIPAAELEDLATTIEREGLIQPVAVRRVGDRYQLVAGHRRVAALRLLCSRAPDQAARDHYSRVNAVVVSVSDEQASVMSLTENVARIDLNPVEIGDSIARTQEQFGLSTEDLAARVGPPVRRVQRLLRLHLAPKPIRDAVSEGILVDGEARGRRKLDVMAALELAAFFKTLLQRDAKPALARLERHVQRALAAGWSVRRIQAFCKSGLDGGSKPEAPPAGASTKTAAKGLRVEWLTTGEHADLASVLERIRKKGSVLDILKRLVGHLEKKV